MNVVDQYAKKRTNIAKHTNNVPEEGVEFPALTFCFKPSFKPSMIQLHNIPSLFCIDPDYVNETTQSILDNANMTWNEFCMNISYKLERDFTIDLFGGQFDLGTQLKKGINKYKEKEVEIREIFTHHDGLCYVMLSNLFFTQYYMVTITMLVSFSFTYTSFRWCVGNYLFLFKKIPEEGGYPKLGVLATSASDIYGNIFGNWIDLEPFKTTLDFGNYFNINFKKTLQLFYFCNKEKAPKSYYDCFAELMSYANSTKCTKNCISARMVQGYLPLMKDQSMLKDCTPVEELCVEKDPSVIKLHYNSSKCAKPCNITQYTADVEYKDYGFKRAAQSINMVFLYQSSIIKVFEEYPIYDLRGMLGSIGGSLGICVGFSIFDVLSRIVDKIFGV